jgi:hypothetical protein
VRFFSPALVPDAALTRATGPFFFLFLLLSPHASRLLPAWPVPELVEGLRLRASAWGSTSSPTVEGWSLGFDKLTHRRRVVPELVEGLRLRASA